MHLSLGLMRVVPFIRSSSSSARFGTSLASPINDSVFSPSSPEHLQVRGQLSSSSSRGQSQGQSSSIEPAPPSTPHALNSASSTYNCPRAHSIRTISNAKIKTVKLTIVVVLGYLCCSAPFVFIQLYAVFGELSKS